MGNEKRSSFGSYPIPKTEAIIFQKNGTPNSSMNQKPLTRYQFPIAYRSTLWATLLSFLASNTRRSYPPEDKIVKFKSKILDTSMPQGSKSCTTHRAPHTALPSLFTLNSPINGPGLSDFFNIFNFQPTRSFIFVLSAAGEVQNVSSNPLNFWSRIKKI